jgi:hypothetical protein
MTYSIVRQGKKKKKAKRTGGLRPRIRDAKNSPPSGSSILVSLSGKTFLCAFRKSLNLLVPLTTSACIAKPMQGAIGSVTRGMCTGTKPTLTLSMSVPSNGPSLTRVGVSPDGCADRNGPSALCEAKREALSRSARCGVDGTSPATERAMAWDSETPFQIVQVEILSGTKGESLTVGIGSSGFSNCKGASLGRISNVDLHAPSRPEQHVVPRLFH